MTPRASEGLREIWQSQRKTEARAVSEGGTGYCM